MKKVTENLWPGEGISSAMTRVPAGKEKRELSASRRKEEIARTVIIEGSQKEQEENQNRAADGRVIGQLTLQSIL